MKRCQRCLVSGRVQGVWFRASTREQAMALGLSGSASNLPDGRVEVLACGDGASLEQLSAWLWQGPPAAQVTAVECREVPVEAPSGFTIA
jgi:acylphosphatase